MTNTLTLSVPDMTCAHCKQAVTEAVHRVAPDAGVAIDLTSKQVTVTGQADREAVLHAIDEAGYTSAPV